MKYGMIFVVVAATLSGAANAATYAIEWTGRNDITLSGTFSFSDALVGTGPIDGADLDSLEFSVFENGTLLGGSDLAASVQRGFINFNFDTNSEAFLVGGPSFTSTAGQEWGSEATFRFRSGSIGQVVRSAATGNLGGIMVADSTLKAIPTQPGVIVTPLPAAGFMLVAGLGGLCMVSRRRKAAT